jgi:hypothetical protein
MDSTVQSTAPVSLPRFALLEEKALLFIRLWRGIHTGKVRKYEQGKEIHQWQRKMKLFK